jgi:hypothetical protein
MKKKNKDEIKPSKKMQKAIDLFPSLVKKKERVAKEKARILKNFRSVRHKLFAK